MTGGYMPLGATVATEAIYDAFLSEDRTRTFFHGHSFTANPLACAVAIASLDCFAGHRRAREGAGDSKAGCKPASSRSRALPLVGDVRVIGGVGIVELVADKRTKAAGGYLDTLGPRADGGVPRARAAAAPARQRAVRHAAVRHHRGRDTLGDRAGCRGRSGGVLSRS